MGCDIHCFVEQKIDGAWVNDQPMVPSEVWDSKAEEHVDGPLIPTQVRVWRDYCLFGALANVRREYDGLSKDPRGIPVDVSDEINAAHEEQEGDAHSASYATLEELEMLTLASALHAEAVDHGVASSLRDFIKTLFPENAEPDAYRVVFWFDN